MDSLPTASKAAGHSYRPIYYGIATSLSNPYFFLWWFTVGAVFMFQGLRLAGLVGLASFFIGHWTSDFSWYGFSDFSWYGFVAICTERGLRLQGIKSIDLFSSAVALFYQHVEQSLFIAG